MDRLIAYLVRFAAIVLGYGVAILATSLFLHILIFPTFGFSTEEAPWAAMGGLLVSVPFIALLVGYFAFFPSALAIVVAEASGRRGFLFHVLAGGLVAMATGIAFRASGGLVDFGFDEARIDAPLPVSTETLLAVIAAGMVGGIAYWTVAGRGAGSWRGIPED